MKIVRIKLSEEAEATYLMLQREARTSKLSRSIFNGIEHKKEVLKTNPFYGENVSKKLFPHYLVVKYGITNLVHNRLPQFWRMTHSVMSNEDKTEIIILILEIADHPTYDKRFGYEKK